MGGKKILDKVVSRECAFFFGGRQSGETCIHGCGQGWVRWAMCRLWGREGKSGERLFGRSRQRIKSIWAFGGLKSVKKGFLTDPASENRRGGGEKLGGGGGGFPLMKGLTRTNEKTCRIE